VFFPPKLSEIPELTDIKKVSWNFEALKGGGRVKDGRSILHE
jgi:hypothetical protein